MKISFHQLTQTIKQKKFPIYMVSGSEPLLVDEAIISIRNSVKNQGFEEREILYAESEFNWQALETLAKNLTLLQENLIIELHMPTGKPGNSGAKILQEYTTNIPQDKILIIITEKIDTNIQKTNWFKAIDKVGLVVQVWPLDANQFPGWIANKLKQFGLQTDSAGIKVLAEHTMGNLLAAMQEIEKLHLIYGAENLTSQQILAAIVSDNDNSRFNIFSLTDCLYQNDPKQIIRIIKNLQNEGIESVLLLWALARELRMLLKLKMITDKNQLDQELQNYRIKPTQKILVKNFLQKHDQCFLEAALQKAAEIDLLIKGIDTKITSTFSNSGNVWQELERLCLKISETSQRSLSINSFTTLTKASGCSTSGA